LKIYEEIYGPQNMVVVIYGVIKEEEGINKIIQYFGDWTKSSKVMKREIANEPQERNELIIENEGIVLARMAIGFKTTHFKENKDLYALEVLNDILSKRLYKRINKKCT
jgi:predicted Zn-dependent peptidase